MKSLPISAHEQRIARTVWKALRLSALLVMRGYSLNLDRHDVVWRERLRHRQFISGKARMLNDSLLDSIGLSQTS